MKIICLLLAALGISGCASGSSAVSKLETVQDVDLNRYTGDWFEIARIDHWFQKGCVNSQATYNIRKDGDIEVINKCKVGSKNGKDKEAKGRAWVVDKTSNAKLKVQFPLSGIKLPFLAGDYWIIELDEDYQYVMVGEEKREYLWILSRDKIMPEETLRLLIDKAKMNGFPVDDLVFEGFQE
ncbi:MAG: lipocalin family protein [Emcibacteraceae bacterium]|nr:lipocalin family protein [Emcibacteraceae bacterium]